MPELTPLDDNRQEHFLNGEDLEPITRREHFYAGRESELPAGHQEPETREEWFIQKYRGGGGDVTVVPLSVTDNGTYSEEGKAYSPVSVNVPLPQNAYLLKSVANLPQAIASFNDGEEMVMPSLKVAIEPVQDLHGYDAPWVGGAGKNKFNNTFESTTESGITYTVNPDGTIKANGTSTALKNLVLGTATLNSGSYIINGCPSGGGANIYRLQVIKTTDSTSLALDTGEGASFNLSEVTEVTVRLQIRAEQITLNNLMFYPMIRLASVADATFAPYSNICPISGWSEANVTVADATTDPTVSNIYTIDLDGTRYGGELDVVNGIVTPAPYYASYNGETLTGEWISDRDKYEVGTTPTIGAQVVNIGASGTPVSIQPTAVKSLRGVNNAYANTGDIKDAEYFSKEV